MTLYIPECKTNKQATLCEANLSLKEDNIAYTTQMKLHQNLFYGNLLQNKRTGASKSMHLKKNTGIENLNEFKTAMID